MATSLAHVFQIRFHLSRMLSWIAMTLLFLLIIVSFGLGAVERNFETSRIVGIAHRDTQMVAQPSSIALSYCEEATFANIIFAPQASSIAKCKLNADSVMGSDKRKNKSEN